MVFFAESGAVGKGRYCSSSVLLDFRDAFSCFYFLKKNLGSYLIIIALVIFGVAGRTIAPASSSGSETVPVSTRGNFRD